jgi:hypothetical protein
MNTETITRLAEARIHHDKVIEDMHKMTEAFQSTQEYKNLNNAMVETSLALDKADELFRQEALSEYETAQAKHNPSYDIKLTNSITISDEAAAIKWSITNFTPALSLNKKVFETAVKAGSIPTDLATVEETPKVFVHSDLTDWLVKG